MYVYFTVLLAWREGRRERVREEGGREGRREGGKEGMRSGLLLHVSTSFLVIQSYKTHTN